MSGRRLLVCQRWTRFKFLGNYWQMAMAGTRATPGRARTFPFSFRYRSQSLQPIPLLPSNVQCTCYHTGKREPLSTNISYVSFHKAYIRGMAPSGKIKISLTPIGRQKGLAAKRTISVTREGGNKNLGILLLSCNGRMSVNKSVYTANKVE